MLQMKFLRDMIPTMLTCTTNMKKHQLKFVLTSANCLGCPILLWKTSWARFFCTVHQIYSLFTSGTAKNCTNRSCGSSTWSQNTNVWRWNYWSGGSRATWRYAYEGVSAYESETAFLSLSTWFETTPDQPISWSFSVRTGQLTSPEHEKSR